MWELDYKESWAPKNWCFWIMVLEKTLESPLDCKEIKPVHAKGNQSWIFIGRMLKLKLQYFGHLMQRADSLEKTRCWERLKGGGKGDNLGWDGWMASLTQWTWVWASSRSWWWLGKLSMLQSMGSESQTQLRDRIELMPPSPPPLLERSPGALLCQCLYLWGCWCLVAAVVGVIA